MGPTYPVGKHHPAPRSPSQKLKPAARSDFSSGTPIALDEVKRHHPRR